MAFSKINTTELTKLYEISWNLLGIRTKYNRYLTGFYDVCINIFISVCYPLHLFIGLLHAKSHSLVFQNLTMNIACFCCSVKQLLYRPSLTAFDDIDAIYRELDAHVRTAGERDEFYEKVTRPCKVLLQVYFCMYSSVWILVMLMFCFSEEHDLLYPAWFPFDYKQNLFRHVGVLTYQSVGVLIQIIQNYANDAYPPLALCALSGHGQILMYRIRNIGIDKKKSAQENYNELVECIEDYKRLTRIFALVQEFISWPIFIQFGASVLNFCVSVIVVVYYADELFVYIFYCTMVIGVGFELYFCCYFGSTLELTFYDLPYAIFSCDWVDQDRAFRNSITVFGEFTKKSMAMAAGYMTPINVQSFFSTVKSAYSFFCLVINMK